MIKYQKNFLSTENSKNLSLYLKKNISWKKEELNFFSKKIFMPRLISFCGDKGLNYRYSGQNHFCTGWLPPLLSLNKILKMQGYDFNFVLINYYRNGDDYMGWHSDNEKSLGPKPDIASISLGAARDFLFRKKEDKSIKKKIHLESGSLLIMKGNCQSEWQHSLPKRKRVKEERINLTFRKII